jgi:hypothetical protein
MKKIAVLLGVGEEGKNVISGQKSPRSYDAVQKGRTVLWASSLLLP